MLDGALLKGHCQPHEELCVGGYGDAEKVRRRRGGRVAGVGDWAPIVGLGRRTPLGAIGDATHAEGFNKAVEKNAAAQLYLRELGNAGRARVLIRPNEGEDGEVLDT